MKKIRKLLMLICVLSLVFSLTACGQQKENKVSVNYSEQKLVDDVVTYIEYVAELEDDKLDEMIEEYKALEDDDESNKYLKEGIEQLKSAREDSGAYEGFHFDDDGNLKYKIKESSKNVVISLNAKFEKRDVKITYTFEPKRNSLVVASITYEPKFTFVEKMKKAGMNTVTGILVVIVVLAFLSMVISLFVYVDGVVRALGKIVDAVKKPFQVMSGGDSKKKADDDNLGDAFEQLNKKEESVQSAETDDVDDTEIVAVITAAISASLNTSSDGFVVRSIRRVPNGKWNRV